MASEAKPSTPPPHVRSASDQAGLYGFASLAMTQDASPVAGTPWVEAASYAAFGRKPLAFSTMAANAWGSVIARSDRTLRSTSIPAPMQPAMKRE